MSVMILEVWASVSGDVVRGMPGLSLLTQWPLCALLRGENGGCLTVYQMLTDNNWYLDIGLVGRHK